MKEKLEKEEKRYFCDYFKPISDSALKSLLAIIIVIATIFAITYIALTVSMYEYELDAYPEDAYNQLNEIADNLVIEGVGINSEVLSKIDNYDIKEQNGNIIITYSVKNKTNSFISPSRVNMTLKLSSDFHIISRNPDFSSEEDYSKHIKSQIALASFAIADSIALFLFVICIILHFKSIKKKKNDSENP